MKIPSMTFRNILAIIAVGFTLTGCTSHRVEIQSAPQNATVFLLRNGKWIDAGRTPCRVELRGGFDFENAKLVFPSGEQRMISLDPVIDQFKTQVGTAEILAGSVILTISTFGSGSIAIAIAGLGMVAHGFFQIDRSYEFSNDPILVEQSFEN